MSATNNLKLSWMCPYLANTKVMSVRVVPKEMRLITIPIKIDSSSRGMSLIAFLQAILQALETALIDTVWWSPVKAPPMDTCLSLRSMAYSLKRTLLLVHCLSSSLNRKALVFAFISCMDCLSAAFAVVASE